MYTETMKEYIKKGYARKLSDKDVNTISPWTNYVPPHSVTNVNKLNKLRIAFDAATKFSNTSLNQHLLKGPDLLNSLIGILPKFRESQYAIIGDVYVWAMYKLCITMSKFWRRKLIPWGFCGVKSLMPLTMNILCACISSVKMTRPVVLIELWK